MVDQSRKMPDRKADEFSQRALQDRYNQNEALRRKDGKPRAWFDVSDPDGRGKAITERIVNFLRAVQEGYLLSPRDLIYGLELACQNVFNMEDFPLSKADIEKAREDARAYYQSNRNKVSPPQRRLGPTKR